ncbi:right-handed parallel beta-helix repeat-containing protein [Candidatus Microgenomates bacterium]|nr:right-handed parallel beta-helix repeat-containing protein [Candidatus Microgenomates bacterium]
MWRLVIVLSLYLSLLARTAYAQVNACLVGDANNDGKITLSDYSVWRTAFISKNPVPISPTTGTTTLINIKDYGARGDDTVDDTTAIQSALNAANPGETVIVPIGIYLQTNTIDIPSGITLKAEQAGATIKATNPDKQAIYLRGRDSAIVGMTLTSTATVRRESDWHHRIVLEHSTGTRVLNNIVDGGSAAGIFATHATNYQIIGNTVKNTLADAIHNTNQSSYGEVRDNIVDTSGDDGVAVVSYIKDGGYTHHIAVTHNSITSPKARGISVVGGTNVTIDNNSITHTRAAGMYIASEDSYQTYAAKDVTATNNTIDQSNYETTIEHAGIFISGRDGTANLDTGAIVNFINERIRFDHNTIKNTLAKNWHIALLRPFSNHISILNTTIIGDAAKTPMLIDVPAAQYNTQGNTFNGVQLPSHLGDPSF